MNKQSTLTTDLHMMYYCFLVIQSSSTESIAISFVPEAYANFGFIVVVLVPNRYVLKF